MTFAAMSAGALAAVAAVTVAAVVTAYLLRRKALEQTVSNVEFWRRAIERTRSRTLLSRRIPWTSLILSLVTALLIVLDLGDPKPGHGALATTVIVLDADRTMGTTDAPGHTRLDDALRIVRDVIQSDTRSGQVAIVRAGATVQVLVPLTQDRFEALSAVASVRTDDGTADLAGAISLARSIVLTARAPGHVVVVSDRSANETAGARVPVELATVGEASETLAITALDARRDPNSLGEYAVRCEVRSYAVHPGRAHLVIRDRGVVLSDDAIALAPGATTTHLSHGFSSAQAELVARLEHVVIDNGRDALASDDVAYAAVPAAVSTNVLLVTAGNRYLEHALTADPALRVETVDAAGLAMRRNAPGGLARYQVLVLDRITPEPAISHPAMLLFGATDPRLVHIGPEIQRPRVTAFASDHRTLEGLRFDQVQIAHAHRLFPEPDERALVRSGANVLALARDRSGVRQLAFGFDTEGTDLVRRVAFPLLVHNAIVWLDRRDDDFRSWQHPGEPIRVAGTSSVVLAPTGEPLEANGAEYNTGRAGIYHTTDRAVAVNAADDAESLLDPVPANRFHPVTRAPRPPLGALIVVTVLLLLCIEWYVTQRRRLA